MALQRSATVGTSWAAGTAATGTVVETNGADRDVTAGAADGAALTGAGAAVTGCKGADEVSRGSATAAAAGAARCAVGTVAPICPCGSIEAPPTMAAALRAPIPIQSRSPVSRIMS